MLRVTIMLKYRLCKFFASCLHAAESWHPIYQHQCLTVRLMLARLWVTTSACISWSLSRPKLFLDHHRIFLNDQILGKILVNFQLGWNPLTFYASRPDLNIYGDRNVNLPQVSSFTCYSQQNAWWHFIIILGLSRADADCFFVCLFFCN